MADNNQTDSRIDANESSPRQVYSEQQLAILAQQKADVARKVAASAAERAARAASGNAYNPATGGMPAHSRDGIQPGRSGKKGK